MGQWDIDNSIVIVIVMKQRIVQKGLGCSGVWWFLSLSVLNSDSVHN